MSRPEPRDLYAGLAAAVAALVTMAAVAAAGLLLLGAGRGGFGRLTAAVVSLAAGGSAQVTAALPGRVPLTLTGDVRAMPLGVTLAGAVVLGAVLLRRGRDGLLVRGAVAAVVFTAGAAVAARLARGTTTLGLPDRSPAPGGGCGPVRGLPVGGDTLDVLGVGFAVPAGPVAVSAAALALVVAGAAWLVGRPGRAGAVLWPAAAVTVLCLGVAWVWGGPPAAGAVVLALPAAALGVLLLGLGRPLTVDAGGPLSCVLDGARPLPVGGTPAVVAAVVLIGYAVVFCRGRGGVRFAAGYAAAVAALLAAAAVLTRASVALGVGAFGFSVPVLDARIAADPVAALVTGLAVGAAAGMAAGALVRILAAWKGRGR